MKHASLSPSGDLSKRQEESFVGFFKRKIKGIGKPMVVSPKLPFRPESMQGDSPGIKVRTATPDKVV